MVLTYADGRSASATDTTYQTQYAYDSAGRPDRGDHPAGAGYPSGRTTTYAYTDGTTSAGGYQGAVPPGGCPTRRPPPGGAVTTTLYYADGDVGEVTDPDGQRTVYTYDGLGRKTSKTVYSDTYPSGLATTYTYDANGPGHRDRPGGHRPGDRRGAHRADHHQLRRRRRRDCPRRSPT